MATYSRVKTFVANETLTASDLNTEFNNIITNTNSGNLNSDNVSTSAAWTWTGYHTYSTSSRIVLADNIYMTLGNATDGDYRLRYNSSSTALELTSTNSDGSGTDAVVMDVQDGTDDVRIRGGLSTNNNAAPTSGIVTGGNIVSDTDGTDDLGTTGVRWANLYVDAATITNNLTVGGTLTLTGGLTLNGNVTVGDNASDTLTINSTITSNLIFTDATYDIGASGATRPRDLHLSRNALMGGTLGVTGLLTATGGVTSGSNIVSDTDSTDNLGTTSVRWANLYVDSIGDTGQALAITAGSNNVNVTAGTLALTGAQTISSTLGVTGLITASGGVSGALTGNVTGNISGNVTGGTISGTTGTFSSTLAVTGVSTLTGRVGIGGSTITDSHLLNIQGSTSTDNVGVVLNKTNSTAQIWAINNTEALNFHNQTTSLTPLQITSNNETTFKPSSSNGNLVVKVGSINSDSIRLEAGGTTSTWLESRGYLGHSWYVDSTRRMTLDSTGLGIGTSSPAAPIHTVTGTASGQTPVSNSQAVFEHTAASDSIARVGIIAGQGTGFSVLDFGKKASSGSTMSAPGAITYKHEDDEMFFATTDGTTDMTLDTNGFLLVGYTSSNGSYKLQVNSQIYATNATIATSDGRYKENVQTLSNATDLVSRLNPVQFEWKAHKIHDFEVGKTDVGFIAQEVQAVLSDTEYSDSVVVSNKTGDEEYLGLGETKLIPLLTAAIQELTQRVKELESN